MRLRAITPIVVPDDELARRQIRYDELCPPGVTLHLDNLAAGPDRLEVRHQRVDQGRHQDQGRPREHRDGGADQAGQQQQPDQHAGENEHGLGQAPSSSWHQQPGSCHTRAPARVGIGGRLG